MGRKGVHSERHAVQRHMRKQAEEAFTGSLFVAPTVEAPTPFKDLARKREAEFKALERRYAPVLYPSIQEERPAAPRVNTPKRKDAGDDAWIDAVVWDNDHLDEPGPTTVRHPDTIGVYAQPEPRSIYSPAPKARNRWEPPKPRILPRDY